MVVKKKTRPDILVAAKIDQRKRGPVNAKCACSLYLVVALTCACTDPRTPGPAEKQRIAPDSSYVSLQIAGKEAVISQRVQVAASSEERSRGLMERTYLAADAGMLFIFPERQAPDTGLWMYRTRIPLDAAYLDGHGRILAIRAMEPCADPVSLNCPIYAPGVPYRAALEVNRGFFARHRIAVGDRLVLPPGLSLRAGETGSAAHIE
jgi:uncharacterized membrane protein (UPF0127 family)